MNPMRLWNRDPTVTRSGLPAVDSSGETNKKNVVEDIQESLWCIEGGLDLEEILEFVWGV